MNIKKIGKFMLIFTITIILLIALIFGFFGAYIGLCYLYSIFFGVVTQTVSGCIVFFGCIVMLALIFTMDLIDDI